MRVFLSRTSEFNEPIDGVSYVDAVEEVVIRSGNALVDMRWMPASPHPPAEVCEDKLADSDVLVGLLGSNYGSLVRNDGPLSYTEFEFEVAGRMRIPRLMFIQDEAATALSRGAGLVQSACDHRQAIYRLKASRERLVARFSSIEQLRLGLFAALAQLREDALRHKALDDSMRTARIQELISESAPSANWCAWYLAGLATGARSRIPIRADKECILTTVGVSRTLASADTVQVVEDFLHIRAELAGNGIFAAEVFVRYRRPIEAIGEYLTTIVREFPAMLTEVAPDSYRLSKETVAKQVDLLDPTVEMHKLRADREFGALEMAARGYAHDADPQIRNCARSELFRLVVQSDVSSARRIRSELHQFVKEGHAEASDYTRLVALTLRDDNVTMATALVKEALRRWPRDDHVYRSAKEVAFRTGNRALREWAERCHARELE